MISTRATSAPIKSKMIASLDRAFLRSLYCSVVRRSDSTVAFRSWVVPALYPFRNIHMRKTKLNMRNIAASPVDGLLCIVRMDYLTNYVLCRIPVGSVEGLVIVIKPDFMWECVPQLKTIRKLILVDPELAGGFLVDND